MHKAVFLDRDGTIIKEAVHLSRPSQVELLPGAPRALRRLSEVGYLAVVVTNQSVIARGLVTETGLREIHKRMDSLLLADGAKVDAVYYCPHHPEVGDPPYRSTCGCRKPRPGLLQQAAADLGIDLAGSYMVGDKLSDLEAGWNAGCRAILVLTGYGREVSLNLDPSLRNRIDHVEEDLIDAAKWIGSQCQLRQ